MTDKSSLLLQLHFIIWLFFKFMVVQQFIYKTSVQIHLGRRTVIVKGAGSAGNESAC